MSWQQAEVRTLKVGRYVIIEDSPCKITGYNASKPGKHGEAKARVEGVDIFTGQKRSFVSPVTHKIKVPMIDKRGAQVIAIQGGEVQLMDLETYEMFNVPIPEEFADSLVAGGEVQYLIAMDRKKITKI